MKLSEALRLGEFALPPAKRTWFAFTAVTGRLCGACAVGRAVYAAGFRPAVPDLAFRIRESTATLTAPCLPDDTLAMTQFFDAQWPWTRRAHTGRPRFWLLNPVLHVISLQYEHLGKSLSEIADYIEPLEAQYDPDPATIDVAPNVAGDATQLQEVQ